MEKDSLSAGFDVSSTCSQMPPLMGKRPSVLYGLFMTLCPLISKSPPLICNNIDHRTVCISLGTRLLQVIMQPNTCYGIAHGMVSLFRFWSFVSQSCKSPCYGSSHHFLLVKDPSLSSRFRSELYAGKVQRWHWFSVKYAKKTGLWSMPTVPPCSTLNHCSIVPGHWNACPYVDEAWYLLKITLIAVYNHAVKSSFNDGQNSPENDLLWVWFTNWESSIYTHILK